MCQHDDISCVITQAHSFLSEVLSTALNRVGGSTFLFKLTQPTKPSKDHEQVN
jgi:hypothetical protein